MVHNGSSLFSGDAGSGESQIRKHFFDNDWVEAIIQLPTDEFFNTNIYTYLWIFNKNKSLERKDKVMLINASEKFELLKKNKGKKRKEITPKYQKEIVKVLENFQENDFAKIFDKEFFYYNKQALVLTNLDENKKSIEDILPVKIDKNGEEKRDKSIKLNPIKITKKNEIIFDTFVITDLKNLKIYNKNFIQEKIKELDYKEDGLKVITDEAVYYFDKDKETIIKEIDEKKEELGNGKIVIKSSYKKATKTQKEKIIITVELTPDYQTDYEIIPFARDEEENQKNIDDFMEKYITKPFVLGENKIGVEINFNKVFYKPESLRPLEEIVSDLKKLDEELKTLESKLGI